MKKIVKPSVGVKSEMFNIHIRELENQFKKYDDYFISSKDKIIELPDTKPNRVVTFQESLKVTLILGQVLAFIPFDGVFSKCPSEVKFKARSWKAFYTYLVMCGQIFLIIMACENLLTYRSLNSFIKIILFSVAFATTVIFLKIGAQWPRLVQKISKIEDLDPNIDVRLKKRTYVACFIVMFFAIVELMMSILSTFMFNRYCHPQNPINTYEKFTKTSFTWIFVYIPYSDAVGIMCQYLIYQVTLTWNFSDLFVISISLYLTSRLQQINKKLLKIRGKSLPESFWRAAREEYCRATQLVRTVGDVIGGNVFISFATNSFFVCQQLYNCLSLGLSGNLDCEDRVSEPNIMAGYLVTAYYFFSLICLISRLVGVSLIAAQINAASLVPAAVLYEVPSSAYCVEVERFINQINSEKVALTGLQFFGITRGLLLTVSATIVTYELVLVQYNTTPTAVSSTTTAATLLYNGTTIST